MFSNCYRNVLCYETGVDGAAKNQIKGSIKHLYYEIKNVIKLDARYFKE